jgi:uncharacterized membrane protein YfcA
MYALLNDMHQKYTYEDYEKLILEISRNPVRPELGIPIFFAGLTLSFLAMTFLDSNFARLFLFLFLFTFPYYAFQLIIQQLMQRHLSEARRVGYQPFYTVTNIRFGAAVYIGFFFIATGWLMLLDKLIKFLSKLMS